MHSVSIIVPCYNEQATISLLLDALNNQTYPRQDMEVIIADGMSTDGTRQAISEFQAKHPELPIQVVDNPRRIIPAGLNHAIRASTGEFIVRLDAHSVPYPDYVERCVIALLENLGVNVGGVWEIKPARNGWIAKAIAAAASHPLGVGDAYYRYTGFARPVDTVPFGAFRRSLIDQVGMFDETLLTNEDYEFNVRIRQANGQVWLDPSIRSIYFARPTLSALLRQYWRYGFWKGRMLRRYPHTLRWRQALPPLFVLSLISLILMGFWFPLAHILLLVELVIYLSTLLFIAAIQAITNKEISLLVGMPLAIVSMHLSWGAALLVSLTTTATTRA